MKRIQADFPYEDYWLYIVLHKKENRRMANLVKKNTNSKERITISYARYLMSVYLKRYLDKNEHVDHIDNNPLNDEISNYQILTPEENRAKMLALKPKELLELNCSGCNQLFNIEARNYRSRIKNGYKRFFCSKDCYKQAR